MSIPQICPSCGNHISTAHAKDCCYGTSEYAHIGWPSYQVGAAVPDVVGVTDSPWGKLQDSASAIQRLLEYLNEEPEEAKPEPSPSSAFTTHAVLVLTKRAEELRKEAAGMYNIEARAKRIFAADILDGLISAE